MRVVHPFLGSNIHKHHGYEPEKLHNNAIDVKAGKFLKSVLIILGAFKNVRVNPGTFCGYWDSFGNIPKCNHIICKSPLIICVTCLILYIMNIYVCYYLWGLTEINGHFSLIFFKACFIYKPLAL